jgi:hypothetical protein
MQNLKQNLKYRLLSVPFSREFLFFLFGKKVYKGIIDKKIKRLLKGKKRLSLKKLNDCIVSLTSFPERIAELKYTVFSLLDQTVLPEKIVLWLAESQFPNKEADLPPEIIEYREFGLEISWCKDLRSYKKLISALEQFPGYYIVTADDDVYYKRRWLEKLWNEHLKYPNEAICHVSKKMLLKNNSLLSYKQWKYNYSGTDASFLNFPVGLGGVLWHKNYFYKDIARQDLFMKLAPYADDIWFYVQAILNKTYIRIVKHPYNKIKYVNPYREYNLISGYKLTAINVDNNQNDIQIQNTLKHYSLDLSLLT